MISHEDKEQLSSYLDNELEGTQLASFRERLMREPELRRALDAMKEADGLLRAYAGQMDNKPLPAEIHKMISGKAGLAAVKLFAMAATVFAVTLGFFITSPAPQDITFLDQLASGERVTTNEGFVEVLATFRQHDGRYCREFVTNINHGVACRRDNRWSLVVEVEAASSQQPMPDDVYIPASGGAITRVDQYIGANMSGIALGNPEEADLMARSWE